MDILNLDICRLEFGIFPCVLFSQNSREMVGSTTVLRRNVPWQPIPIFVISFFRELLLIGCSIQRWVCYFLYPYYRLNYPFLKHYLKSSQKIRFFSELFEYNSNFWGKKIWFILKQIFLSWRFVFSEPYGNSRLEVKVLSTIGIVFAALGVIGTIVYTRRKAKSRNVGLLTFVSFSVSGIIFCLIMILNLLLLLLLLCGGGGWGRVF